MGTRTDPEYCTTDGTILPSKGERGERFEECISSEALWLDLKTCLLARETGDREPLKVGETSFVMWQFALPGQQAAGT
jgi:hypothetical protein